MRNRRILSITVALFLLASAFFGMAAVAAAEEPVPVIPASYFGQVFLESYGGQEVADGATVEVYLEEDTVYRGTPIQVQNGWYGQAGLAEKYSVPGTTADFGKDVIFKVNGIVAETYVNGTKTTVTFKEGDVLQVDLVIPDTAPPDLTRTKPAALQDLPYKAVQYTGDTVFEWTADEDLDTAAQAAATFAAAGAADVSGTVVFPDARTVRVVPAADLQPGTTYTLTVTGIKDKAGNAAEAVRVQFGTTSRVTLPEGELTQAEPIAFSGGDVEVTLPAGTVVASGASLEASPVPEPPAVPASLRVAGQVVDITAQGITLPPGEKWRIKLKASADAQNPAIYYYNESSQVWEAVPESTYDPTTGFVTAEVEHLSTYGVLEATVTLEQLKIEPSELTLTVGETKQLVVKAVYSDGTEPYVTSEASYASEYESVATVSATGLITAVDAGQTVVTVTFGGLTVQVPVTVQAAPANYTVSFTVTDQGTGQPVQGAVIAIEGVEVEEPLVTDENGVATIGLPNGDYSFTVTAEGYEAYEGTFTVAGEDLSVDVALTPVAAAPETYAVTFTVTDQEGQPVQGAATAIEGVEGTLVTDENGQASVDLEPGTYNFTVTAEGYQDYQGSFEVVDGDVNVTVVLQVAEGDQPPAEGEQPPEVTEPDTTAPAEVTDLVVTPLPGAGVFGISFTAPSDSDLRGVAVYATVYGSNDWEQVEFENGSMVCSCRPGESVDIPVQAPGNLVLGSDRVQFKVVSIDTSGNASQGVVADNNGQGYPVLAYWSLTSGPEGWTTFSVPVQLAGAQRLLGDVIDNNKVDIAFKFDAATQQWVQVTEENKNNTIQPLEAVYVKLKEPVLAVIKPSTEPTSPPVRNLLKGWNLVGFTKADNVYDALYSVRERWSVAVSPAVNPDPWAVTPRQNAAMKTHYGYWVYMDESGNLAGFSTTPVTVGTYPFERE